MRKFNIEFTETLQKTIEIEAESLDEALTKAKEMYHNEEVVLTSEDFVDVEIDESSQEIINNHTEINLDEDFEKDF